MTLIDVREFLTANGTAAELEREGAFEHLADLTALRRSASGAFYRSNFLRGHLLYALVQRHRPQAVLEIGTGRGYGALCMAMAAEHAGLSTRIYTVDMVPPNQPQSWPIQDAGGARVDSLALRQVWSRLPASWTHRVELLTGSSVNVMRRWLADQEAPAIDFAFVDGGHDYWTVRHDVLAALLSGRGRSVTLVLDDYGGVQGQDVRRFTDETLSRVLPERAVRRLSMPQRHEERQVDGEHGMVYIDGSADAVTSDALLKGRPPRPVMAVHRLAARGAGATRALRHRVGILGRALRAR